MSVRLRKIHRLAYDRSAERADTARTSSRAFTLIELVIVIAAIAILSLIAIPKYASAVNRYRVDIAAKRVVSDLALARASARANGVDLVVNFATPANGYTLVGVAAADGKAGDYTVKLSDEPYKVSLGSAAFGTPATTSVTFTKYGTPKAAGGVIVSSGDYSKTVLLDGITGRAEVQ
jgi:prepilin-type N-terminal cleavage/methylation domain-containing protein